MIIIFLLILLFVTVVFFYTKQNRFGKAPLGNRLEILKESPNFSKGKFQNFHYTPQLTDGANMWKLIYASLFERDPRRKPIDVIPSVKTDLHNLPVEQDVLIWFGHSSYFIQIDGKKVLVDPVFSGNASPIPNTNQSFKGTEIYTVDDLPEIDYLFISHDHYDHLDYETIIQLKSKIRKVICGLGVGAHFEHWDYLPEIIIEKDWNETVVLEGGFEVYTLPARHFSGRGFSRNNTLWLSFLLQTPSMKIFLGGDSGFDTHFADIGKRFGPIDLAILENGQYNKSWKYIHSFPDQVLQIAKELKAKQIFPVHSSKFALGNHPWDEPLKEITKLNLSQNIPLVTPIIGEVVYLKDTNQTFKKWWVGLK